MEEQVDKWTKSSYPFFNADKIKTPTLFMGGEKDFNVPIAGGEQMYQALKSLGVDTQLVIYPGQFHGLTMPSYERDRLQRYVNWFNKYLAAEHDDDGRAAAIEPHAPSVCSRGSAFVGAALVIAMTAAMSAQSADMRTRAEISNYEETSTYADVDARHRRPGRDQPARPHRELRQDRRRPRAAADGDLGSEGDDAGAARKLGRPIVFVQANIHAGEVEGKEAILKLARRLVSGDLKPMTRQMVFLIAPDYNADGNEKVNVDEPDRAERSGRRRRHAREQQGPRSQSRLHEAR